MLTLLAFYFIRFPHSEKLSWSCCGLSCAIPWSSTWKLTNNQSDQMKFQMIWLVCFSTGISCIGSKMDLDELLVVVDLIEVGDSDSVHLADSSKLHHVYQIVIVHHTHWLILTLTPTQSTLEITFYRQNNEMRWQKKIDYHPVIILICVYFSWWNFIHKRCVLTLRGMLIVCVWI